MTRTGTIYLDDAHGRECEVQYTLEDRIELVSPVPAGLSGLDVIDAIRERLRETAVTERDPDEWHDSRFEWEG